MVMAARLIRAAFGARYAMNEGGGQENVGSLSGCEVRVRRSRRTDPIVLVMFNPIAGADLFPPIIARRQGNGCARLRRGKYLQVLHSDLEPQSVLAARL